MIFNTHYELKGQHSFLSPSNYHWLNYSEEKLIEVYNNKLATERGTRLHEFAAEAIRLGIELDHELRTLNMYVNDAIGFRMVPEQPLVYSENCWGTADAISYRKGVLRIHDLKTGMSSVSMAQLDIYAALFFLEYKNYKPEKTKMELRIYQNNEVVVHNPHADEIREVMDKIISSDKVLEKIKSEV